MNDSPHANGSASFTTESVGAEQFMDLFCRVRDGRKLYGRRYSAKRPGKLGRPVLCLPGLTRNSRDFHELAVYLASHEENPRDVYTLDFRGRGNSEWDDNWKNYAVPVEAADVVDFAAMAGLHDAAIVGTSRGGLVSMVLAAMQPGLIGCVVLNDIGPKLELDGLLRIAGYVGQTNVPRTWDDAAKLIKDISGGQFPNLDDEGWKDFARRIFDDANGRPAQSYDPKIGNAFKAIDGPMPEIWPQFEAFAEKPVLVLRGANSDLFSAETVSEMERRLPNCTGHTVADEGHAPLLLDEPTQARIARFLAETD